MASQFIKTLSGFGRSFRPTYNSVQELNLIVLTRPPTKRGKRGGRCNNNLRFVYSHSTDNSDNSTGFRPIESITSLFRKCSSRNQLSPSNLISINPIYKMLKQIADYNNNIPIQTIKRPLLSQQYMTFGYLNARSIKNKTDDVCDFVTDNSLDVCALTETWLSGTKTDKITIGDTTPSGYEMRHVSRCNKKGGGVAVIHKTSLIVKSIKTNHHAFESIELLITSNKASIRLIVIYRPPKESIPDFINTFQDYIASHSSSTGQLLVVGDFNIHMDDVTNPHAINFNNVIFSQNLKQHVHTPTHIHGHTLDLILTRENGDFIHSIICHPPVISDHTPLTFSAYARKATATKQTITYRKTTKIEIEQFKSDIEKSDLILSPSNDLTELVTQYNSTLKTLIEKHAPLTTKVIKIKPNSPWFNNDIKQAKVQRRRAERKWIKTKLHVDLDIVKEKRLTVNRLCTQAKEQYYGNKISQSEGNQKQLFKIVDSLMHKTKNNTLQWPNENNKQLANKFADFFTTKIQKITNVFPRAHSHSPNEISCNTEFRTFKSVDNETIKNIIMSGNSKSCHLDPLPTTVLKQVIDHILPAITKIVNLSFTTCTFPTDLKTASVTPIAKKPNTKSDDFQNYRPISNLPYISKIIEKSAVNQLNNYMTENNLYEPCQSAYRKQHSTETALIKIMNDLLLALDENKSVLLVMLDLSAAFDTVNHEILIRRMQNHFGITQQSKLWLTSYFTNRSQFVKINQDTSSVKPLNSGLPQGSLLGPFQFPPYTAPLFQIARRHNITMHMYADDTQLYIPFNSSEYASAIHTMQACIEDIRSWMNVNHLKLNETKTEFLVIGKNNLDNNNHVIKIGDDMVNATEKAKNIGAILDSNLDLTTHVNSICHSSYYHLYSIGKIRKYLSTKSTEALIHALITSKLDHLNSLLYGLPEYLIKRLQTVQNSAARLLTRNNKREHITPILKELHWLPVSQRIVYKICLTTFKVMHQKSPQYLTELITLYKPIRCLRSENKSLLIAKRLKKKKAGYRCFQYAAANCWNALPVDVRHCHELSSFKILLKTFLFKQAYSLY